MPKVPKPPAPVPPPTRPDAELESDKIRRRLALRQGAAAAVKTGPSGAADYGKNTQLTGLTGAPRATLGVGQ